MTTTPTKLITADEFLHMPDDGKVYELEEGRLIDVGGASWRSSTVAATLIALIYAFATPRRLGKVSGAGLGTKLAANPDTVRVPDVAFVSAARLPDGRGPSGFLSGAPDHAIQVLSPSDRYRATLRKVREYLATGARLVWVIDPDERSAVVQRADGTISEYGEDGVINGGDVLPGFTLNLSDIWEEVTDER